MFLQNQKIQKLSSFCILAVLICAGNGPVAHAESTKGFSNTIFIGDSNSDNGRFFYLPDPIGGGTHATGVFTTSPGLMWSEALGKKFDIDVRTSAAPGGGNNYAAGGSTVATADGGRGDVTYANEWSGVEQVQAYLANVKNHADPSALYTVYIGNNNLHSWYNLASALPDLVDDTVSGPSPNPLSLAERQTQIVALAGQTANLVSQLHNAGGNYFLVPGDFTVGSQAAANAINYTAKTLVAWEPSTANAVQLYNASMWNQIAAKGINFIPADFYSVANYVVLNPAQFGITNTDWTKPVCGATLSIDCTTANWVAGRNGANTLFADGNGHLAAAGQQIEADYSYGLIAAPSEVSTLANQAFLAQVARNDTYMKLIDGNFHGAAPHTVSYWVQGGANQIGVKNSFANSSGVSNDEAVGIDYQYSPRLMVGGFLSTSDVRAALPDGGRLDETGVGVGTYADFKLDNFWINGLASYDWLSSDLTRITPIGITSFANDTNDIGGSIFSLNLETGYMLGRGRVEHGPVFGYSYVDTNIDSFTESGNFNSLRFDSQNISHNILSGGYRMKADMGNWQPSLKASYNAIVGSTNRNVTANLTSVSAPGYYMPAASYGSSWIDLSAGLGYRLSNAISVEAGFTGRVNQESVDSYGGTLALVGHF